jgi:hypothetical protein
MGESERNDDDEGVEKRLSFSIIHSFTNSNDYLLVRQRFLNSIVNIGTKKIQTLKKICIGPACFLSMRNACALKNRYLNERLTLTDK